MNLIILGNGFDLAHNLHTGYKCFECFLSGNNDHKALKDVLETLCDKSALWTDFEQSLGNMNGEVIKKVRQLLDEAGDPYKNTHQWIEGALGNWLITTIFGEPVRNKYVLDINDMYFSFNYTHTLEDTYGIPDNNIKHIHGRLFEGGEPGNLMFGHENTTYENDDSKSVAEQVYKNVSEIITSNSEYFDNLSKMPIDTIKVFGFSYSEIDFPYFKKICHILPYAKWEFGYNTDKDLKNAKRYADCLKINESDYEITSSENVFSQKENTNG